MKALFYNKPYKVFNFRSFQQFCLSNLMKIKMSKEELIMEAEEGMAKLKELESFDGWEKNIGQPGRHYNTKFEGRIAARGITIVPIHFDKVKDYMGQDDTLLKIAPMALQMLKVESGDNYQVNYTQYKGIWPLGNRQYVTVKTTEELQNKFYITSRSVDYPFLPPKPTVRAELNTGGFVIQKLDEENTQVTYISDIDLKGTLPSTAKPIYLQTEASVADHIQTAMENDGIQ